MNIISKLFQNLRAPASPFISFTSKLQIILEDMLLDSQINLTINRMEISQISPEKEMIQFIDQMQRVSVQVSKRF